MYVATALPVNSVSVTMHSSEENYVPPLEFGGAKSFFFRDLGGGLAPPSPCVEPPLVLLPGVLAELTTYPAPIFTGVIVSVRMTMTSRTSIKLTITMMATICK